MVDTVVIVMMAIAAILLLFAFVILFPYLVQEARDDDAAIRAARAEGRPADVEPS